MSKIKLTAISYILKEESNEIKGIYVSLGITADLHL